jgi:hypothetical protein
LDKTAGAQSSEVQLRTTRCKPDSYDEFSPFIGSIAEPDKPTKKEIGRREENDFCESFEEDGFE